MTCECTETKICQYHRDIGVRDMKCKCGYSRRVQVTGTYHIDYLECNNCIQKGLRK